jgi:predicted metal-dependent phosphoesterase TrpH
MTPEEAVELILQAKGLPVLAHPFTIPDVEEMVAKLKAAGLVGIEAYYGGYSTDEISRLVGLAYKYNLVTSGGSDFHGLDESTETMIGGIDVPMEAAERIITLAERQVQQTRR